MEISLESYNLNKIKKIDLLIAKSGSETDLNSGWFSKFPPLSYTVTPTENFKGILWKIYNFAFRSKYTQRRSHLSGRYQRLGCSNLYVSFKTQEDKKCTQFIFITKVGLPVINATPYLIKGSLQRV